jgi:hypothetical protein
VSRHDPSRTVMERAIGQAARCFQNLEAQHYVLNGKVYFKAAVWEKYQSISVLRSALGIVEIGGPRRWTTLIGFHNCCMTDKST